MVDDSFRGQRDARDEALVEAVRSGDEARLRRLLVEGARADAAMHAAADGPPRVRSKMMELLIDEGVDIHATYGFMGHNLLGIAAGVGDVQLIQRLIALGAESTRRDECGYTPLDLALARGRFAAACLLAKMTGDARSVGQLARACFWGAILDGVPEELGGILDATPELLDNDKEMAAAWMAGAGSVACEIRDPTDDRRLRLVKLLEARLASRHGKTIAELPIDRTPLLGAMRALAKTGDLVLLRHLADQSGVRLTAEERDELLEAAIYGRSLDVAAELIETGVTERGLDGALVATMMHFDVQELLEEDFGIPHRPEEDVLPMVKKLLEAGASPDVQLLGHLSLLMIAAQRHELSLMRLLLEYGADPNLGDINGRTAMAYARKHANPANREPQREAISLLFDHGAHPAAWTLTPDLVH